MAKRIELTIISPTGEIEVRNCLAEKLQSTRKIVSFRISSAPLRKFTCGNLLGDEIFTDPVQWKAKKIRVSFAEKGATPHYPVI